jgi:flagellar protein FliS
MLNQYVASSVDTMSPGRAIVALYDRMLIDLDRAVAALAIDNVAAAHRELVHAQEIVAELHLALDVEAWEAAAGLADLYRFVHAELIAANVEKDPSRIAACRELMRPLRDAWNQIVNVAPGGDEAA